MKNSHLKDLLTLLLAAVVISGCGGMKVTFINEPDKVVAAEFVTQGGRTDLGEIAPGKKKSYRKHFDTELLPADFNITLDGATPETLTRSLRIQK